MKRKQISDVLDNIDPAYIDEAVRFAGKKRRTWVKWTALAACLAVIVIAGAVALPGITQKNIVMIGGIERSYRNMDVSQTETAIIWPWEYLTVYEQYGSMEFDGNQYQMRAVLSDASLVQNKLGVGKVTGTDEITGETHSRDFSVYALDGFPPESMLAAEIEGEYAIYFSTEYDPPKTLGALIDCYHLTETLPLTSFWTEESYYTLANDNPVWEILSGCREAQFVETEQYGDPDVSELLTFTATSDLLGVHNRAFAISKSGYLWTNVFDWAYIYEIGEDAASRIFDYAEQYAEKANYQPDTESLVGTVTEVTENYILLSDVVMCKREKDALTYKVPTDALTVRRCVEWLHIKAGDTVSVQFDGHIDTSDQNTVTGAVSITPVTISDGMAMVME